MRRLRDVFYIKAYPQTNEAIYYGMEMQEFMRYAPVRPNKLLLIESQYGWGDFHQHTQMRIAENQQIDGLLKDDIYGYGDFC